MLSKDLTLELQLILKEECLLDLSLAQTEQVAQLFLQYFETLIAINRYIDKDKYAEKDAQQ